MAAAPPRLSRRAAPALAALSLAIGLTGLRWGLPGPERARVLPEGRAPSAQAADDLARRWRELYAEIRKSHEEMRSEEPVTYVKGVVEIPPGWKETPAPLLNSVRSFFLQTENPDEKKALIILSQMRPWRLDFQPLYLQYGGAFVYSLGAFLKTASVLGAFRLTPDVGHYILHPEQMGRIFLAGRLLLLLTYLGSVLVLWDIGRRVSGPFAGFFGALFYALCPGVVINAHVVKPHAFGSFLCLLGVRWALLALESGKRRDYLLSGLFAGLGAGANYVYDVFAIAAPLSWLSRKLTRKAGPRELRWAALSVVLAGSVCLLTNVYLLAAFKDYLWEMHYVAPFEAYLPTQAAGVFARGMGLVLAATAFAALLAAIRAKEAWRRIAAFLAAFCGLAIWVSLRGAGTFSTLMAIRFYHPCVALACLLAADLLSRAPKPAGALLAAAILLDSGVWTLAHLRNLRLDSTPEGSRAQAADWIDANVPAGAALGLLRFPDPPSTPPFRFDRYRLEIVEKPELLDDKKLPDWFVVHKEERRGQDAWLTPRYEVAAEFHPWKLAWADPDDGTSFAAMSFYVLKRR